MMGTVCRVIMRQIPPSCYKLAKCFPPVYPIYLPSAVGLSSSCIYRRRINYDQPGKLDVDQNEEYGEYVLPSEPESRPKRQYGLKRVQDSRSSEYGERVRGGTEYISDEEDSDGPYDDNVDFKIITLPRKSAAARTEMQQLSPGYLEENQLYMAKKLNYVRKIISTGILPKKIFFTNEKDLYRLKSDLRGVKLFKLDECDVPTKMQGKAEPPFFAVFQRRTVPLPSPESPTLETIPLAIAFSFLRDPTIMYNALEAAVMCGCKELIFRQSYDTLTHDRNYTGQIDTIIRRIPSKFQQNWDAIGKKFDSNTCFYALSLLRVPDTDLPTVNLHEVDFWKSKEIVLLVTYSMPESFVKFCESKDAQFITVNGANESFDMGAAAVGAVTFEIWRQWNAASKAKPKTKVNKKRV